MRRLSYPEGSFGIKASSWLEYVSRQSGTHIHHHKCGHGGERLVAGAKVDGYHPETKTVFQYHGCHWHGCIKCFPNPEQRTEVIHVDKNNNEITRDDAYQRTLKRSELIRFWGRQIGRKMGTREAKALVERQTSTKKKRNVSTRDCL